MDSVFSWPEQLEQELAKDRPDLDLVCSLILQTYERFTGVALKRTEVQGDAATALITWLNKNTLDDDAIFYKHKKLTSRLFHFSLSSKISHLAQFHCPICSADLFPVEIIPIRISPESKQVLSRTPKLRMAFEKALRHRFKDKTVSFGPSQRLCILIVFVVSASRKQKDVDNMAKALLDGLKGVIFGDDRYIEHLNLIRVGWSGDEEYVYVNIRKTELGQNRDVLSLAMHHSWAGAESLDLASFV